MIGFGGMDGSAISQAGWRYYLGQTPYVDFHTVAPPCYLVVPGLAFSLFGVSWFSLVQITAIFSAGTFLLHYWLLRRLSWNLRWSLTLAFMTQAITLLPVSWWTYNQTTSIATILFGAAACLLARSPTLRLNQAVLILTMVMLSWMKPNVAGLMLIGTSVILLWNPRTRIVYAACALIGAVISILLLICCRVNPLAMIHSYLASGGRLGNLTMLSICLWRSHEMEAAISLILLVPLFIALLIKGNPFTLPRPWPESYRPILGLAGLTMLCGIFGTATNNEDSMVDAAIILCGAALWLFHPDAGGTDIAGTDPLQRRLPDILACTSVVFFSIFGLFDSISRDRIASIGPGTFFEYTPVIEAQSPPFFKGMLTGERLLGVLSDITSTLAQQGIHDKESVFFGPRIDFGYAAYNFIPHKGMFLWWPGTGEASDEEMDVVLSNFAAWRPRLCLFLINDFTYMPKRMLQYLGENYDVQNQGNLTVLKLREGSRPPAP